MKNIKEHFQIFENYKKEYNRDLIYLDSAASSLTPDSVVEKMNEYYFHYRSNVDRSISDISEKAKIEYDNSRKLLSEYLNCDADDIIWTSGATMSSNMLIDMLSIYDNKNKFLFEGDEILTSIFEHHSSLLPLQKLVKEKKMKLRFLELDDNFNLNTDNIKDFISEKTKILSITLVSNVTGGINNIKNIVREVKAINPKVFVISDMTAAFGHINIDMRDLGQYVDASYFSFHKAFGSTGVGALWLKRDISRNMYPSIVGGGIVSHVERESFFLRSDIKAFEAGTQNIAGIIGVAESIFFLNNIKNNIRDSILEHNQNLVKIFSGKIKNLNEKNKKDLEVKIFSNNPSRNIGIVSFQVFVKEIEIHPHDIADIFARFGIVVRAGHHCAEPLMTYFGLKNGLTSVFFHIYNFEEDIDKVLEALNEVKNIFGK